MTGKLAVMFEFTDEQRLLVAAAVERGRVDKGWGKEEAARHAGISSITWKRVEDGLRVQSTKLRAIEVALGWGGGSMDRVARGRDVVVRDDDTLEQFRERGWADPEDSAIWDGFRASTQFAQDCGARGASPTLVSDFITDAVSLLADVGRIRAHPESSELLTPAPEPSPEPATLGEPSVGSETLAPAALEVDPDLDQPAGEQPEGE